MELNNIIYCPVHNSKIYQYKLFVKKEKRSMRYIILLLFIYELRNIIMRILKYKKTDFSSNNIYFGFLLSQVIFTIAFINVLLNIFLGYSIAGELFILMVLGFYLGSAYLEDLLKNGKIVMICSLKFLRIYKLFVLLFLLFLIVMIFIKKYNLF